MSELLPVILYGATGYTGRLICHELGRRGVPFAIAGRDPAKLNALAKALPGPAVETVVASLDAPAELERMAARARVVLDCAGPFALYGKPVQDAALAAQRHFLDITGEAGYILATQAREAEAKARGIVLLNAVGFDVVPTDVVAALAAEAAGSPVESVKIAWAHFGAPSSHGTRCSMLNGASYGGSAYVDGKYVREPMAAVRWDVPFPEPVGPRACISIAWGDLATAPRTTGTRNIRTFMGVEKPGQVMWMQLWGRVFPVLGIKPIRRLAQRWIDSQPDGPNDMERARTIFSAYAEAVGPRGTHAAWVTAGNGYDLTVATAIYCALRAAEPDFAARGTPTPVQAFGARPLLDAMAKDLGLRWGVHAVHGR